MSVKKMHKRKCTGANCPMQVGYVVPETCPEPEKCRYATFPQTNGDRIRAMTDEALANILYSVCVDSSCGGCPIAPFCDYTFRVVGDWLDWLKAPVEESDG